MNLTYNLSSVNSPEDSPIVLQEIKYFKLFHILKKNCNHDMFLSNCFQDIGLLKEVFS